MILKKLEKQLLPQLKEKNKAVAIISLEEFNQLFTQSSFDGKNDDHEKMFCFFYNLPKKANRALMLETYLYQAKENNMKITVSYQDN